MSADIPALQPAAPARPSGSAGADGASSGCGLFQQMLGQIDAGDAPAGAAPELPAELSNAEVKPGDRQRAETLDELADMLAMLPPPNFPDGVPGEDSGKNPGIDSRIDPRIDSRIGSDIRSGSGIGSTIGSGISMGTGMVSGMLAEARQLLAVLESEPADAPADAVESFASAGVSGEAAPARIAPGSDALPARTVHQSVGTAAWADEIAARMNMMTEQGRHTASLRLSPEHLGPLEIRIAIHDDQASVWFGASHPDTRAALEAAMPRLREMFAAQGLSLADTGVFHEAPRQPQVPASTGRGQPLAGIAAEDPGRSVALRVQVPLGLLDTYA
ncbi:hypothetical protein ACG33_05720 [Steroidobacter denitrificans]|uniref:Flagellar hook-length control protein-like C-terminal domain-containing protein n=1 Tax=Steroidobacter denitrificans TaxID=465721 RepID=A0A127F843_STEDE|nr:flagellar hook-length control protein FliK [Steroidobacter denitrificans]AMN46603.1 hypothetical protein ACG33_05720 [Steroidobacter denitrificans]